MISPPFEVACTVGPPGCGNTAGVAATAPMLVTRMSSSRVSAVLAKWAIREDLSIVCSPPLTGAVTVSGAGLSHTGTASVLARHGSCDWRMAVRYLQIARSEAPVPCCVLTTIGRSNCTADGAITAAQFVQ